MRNVLASVALSRMHLQRPYSMQVQHGPYELLVQDGCARAVLLPG